jgi:streptomycin 6-kinase
MFALPADFTQTIRKAFKEDGERWLGIFPDLLEGATRRWALTDIQPLPNLSYNFVAFARRLSIPSGRGTGDEADCVLKLGVPNRELTGEIAALRHFDGHGAVRLVAADAEKGMLLLERLQPGNLLSELEDDERATRIAADVMSQLWRPAPENRQAFIQLKDWFDGFKRLRRRYEGGTGPLPEYLVARAESLSQELLNATKERVVLHGDLHHFNILESARGWLAIDPKGVIGPKGYELGPLLLNPKPCVLQGDDLRGKLQRRVSVLSERLGLEPADIRAWAFCHAVLSAWWSLEDGDPEWGQYSMRWAELLASIT